MELSQWSEFRVNQFREHQASDETFLKSHIIFCLLRHLHGASQTMPCVEMLHEDCGSRKDHDWTSFEASELGHKTSGETFLPKMVIIPSNWGLEVIHVIHRCRCLSLSILVVGDNWRSISWIPSYEKKENEPHLKNKENNEVEPWFQQLEASRDARPQFCRQITGSRPEDGGSRSVSNGLFRENIMTIT